MLFSMHTRVCACFSESLGESLGENLGMEILLLSVNTSKNILLHYSRMSLPFIFLSLLLELSELSYVYLCV